MVVRRSLAFSIAVLTSMAVVGPADAQQIRRVGPWEISVERDRFATAQDRVIASRFQGGYLFVVRCLSGRLSLALIQAAGGQGRFREGLEIGVRARVDENAIISGDGVGLSDRSIQINVGDDFVRQMQAGREVALRLSYLGTTNDVVFGLSQSRQALQPVLQACGVSR